LPPGPRRCRLIPEATTGSARLPTSPPLCADLRMAESEVEHRHGMEERGQLEAERQAHAEARRLLAAALERIPAIKAPTDSAPEAPGAPETARGVGEKGQPNQIEDPGPPRWTMLLLALSALGVGSAPLFTDLLSEQIWPDEQVYLPSPIQYVPYALICAAVYFWALPWGVDEKKDGVHRACVATHGPAGD
jgi:hypothetical protein